VAPARGAKAALDTTVDADSDEDEHELQVWRPPE
jgi:hypothetical protein